MKHTYLAFLPTLLLVLLLSTGVRAQTTIAVMDFDGTTPEMTFTSNEPFFIGGPMNDRPFDAFFGIHNANGDASDGNPMDTGEADAGNASTAGVAPIAGDFFFVEDFDDEGDNGSNGFATLTFGPVTLSGQTAMQFSFDYNIVDFNTTDEVNYQFFFDGTGQGVVTLPQSGSSSVATAIPDGTGTVYLEVNIRQNGADQFAALDNILVSADNPTDPCGITDFGPATPECASQTAGPDNDTYRLSIPFNGTDADATLVVEVDGSTPSSFTVESGDLAAGTSPLVISSPDFLEGSSFSVSLTDVGGNCVTSITPVTGNVTSGFCNPSCDVSLLTENVTFFCENLTAGIDNVTIDIDYDGSDDNVDVTVTGATNGQVFAGTDLFNVPDGRVQITGIPEGDVYTVRVLGSGCDRTFTLDVMAGFCAASDIVINEYLYDGLTPTEKTSLGIVDFGDPNRDNTFSGGEDEFVEITNIGSSTIDIGGYTLSDQDNADIITIPSGTMLAPGEYFVFFGGGSPDLPCQTATRELFGDGTTFLGLNNTGPEEIIVKDAAGATVAQVTYNGSGSSVNESFVLIPNADPSGSYVEQTSILTPTRYSPCSDNDDISLPIELLDFQAISSAKTVTLNWSTTNEVANDHFVIERSASGSQWQQIGTVLAAGTDAAVYTFRDEQPQTGRNYYRLRQVDIDGAFTVYGPVMAEFTTDQLVAYPNPASHTLWLNQPLAPQDQLAIIDNNGRRLQARTNNDGQLDVSNLRPGLYLLRVERGDQVDVLRFVKR